MTTDNFCFYLQNRLIQTSETGGQWYSDTSSPFSIPCITIGGGLAPSSQIVGPLLRTLWLAKLSWKLI
jgi:hypothetical protein